MDKLEVTFNGELEGNMIYRLFKNKESGKVFPVAIYRVDANVVDVEFLEDIVNDYLTFTQHFDYVFSTRDTSTRDVMHDFIDVMDFDDYEKFQDYMYWLSNKLKFDLDDPFRDMDLYVYDIFNTIGAFFHKLDDKYQFQILPYGRSEPDDMGLNIFKKEDRYKYKNHFVTNAVDPAVYLYGTHVFGTSDNSLIDVIYTVDKCGNVVFDVDNNGLFAVLDVPVKDYDYIEFSKVHYDLGDVESIDDEDELGLRYIDNETRKHISEGNLLVQPNDGSIRIYGSASEAYPYKDINTGKMYVLMDMLTIRSMANVLYLPYDMTILSDIASKKILELNKKYGIRKIKAIGRFTGTGHINSLNYALPMKELREVADKVENEIVYYDDSLTYFKDTIDLLTLKAMNKLKINIHEFLNICKSIADMINENSDRYIAIINQGLNVEDSSEEAINLSVYEYNPGLDYIEKMDLIDELKKYDKFFCIVSNNEEVFPYTDVILEIEPRGEYILCKDILPEDTAEKVLENPEDRISLHYMKKSVFEHFINLDKEGK